MYVYMLTMCIVSSHDCVTLCVYVIAISHTRKTVACEGFPSHVQARLTCNVCKNDNTAGLILFKCHMYRSNTIGVIPK